MQSSRISGILAEKQIEEKSAESGCQFETCIFVSLANIETFQQYLLIFCTVLCSRCVCVLVLLSYQSSLQCHPPLMTHCNVRQCLVKINDHHRAQAGCIERISQPDVIRVILETFRDTTVNIGFGRARLIIPLTANVQEQHFQ